MTTATDIIEILTETRELLARPGAWTQGAFARNANGDSVPATANAATCFCLGGAVRRTCLRRYRAYDSRYIPLVDRVCGLLRHRTRRLDRQGIAEFNDSVADVGPILELIDRTITELMT